MSASEPAARPRRPLSRRRRLAFGLLALLLLLLAGFLGLELALRLSGWGIRSMHPLSALHRHHPRLGWELVPDRDVVLEGRTYGAVHFRTNAQGFRDPNEVPLERTPGRRRVVAIGDSFTWGWGVPVEHVYAQVVERLSGAEVINMGCSAYGTGQAWLMLQERGLAFRPDVVVLGFTCGNDYRDNAVRKRTRPWFGLDAAGKLELDNVPVPDPLGKRLKRLVKDRFLAYYLISYEVARARARLAASERWYGRLYRSLRDRDDEEAELDAGMTFLDSYRRSATEEMRAAWRVTETVLAALRDDCARAGIELLVAVIPGREQVEPETWAGLLRAERADPASLDVELPTRTCAEMCERLGIASVDLLPPLRAAQAAGTAVYLADDGLHWNAEGHEVAGAAITEDLARRGWLTAAVAR